MFNILRQKFRRQPTPDTNRATLDDLRACYRLFLHRTPDPESWAFWTTEIENGQISLAALVDGFLYGAEFQQRQVEANRPHLVQLADFQLFVRLNDYTIGAAIARDKQYEPHVTHAIRQILRPGDWFIDVGANIGYFSLLAGTIVGSTGQVIAFEPNPNNCDLIEQSIAANQLANITVHRQAVAESPQTFNLDVAGPNTNGRIIDNSPQAVLGMNPPLYVTAVVLDDFLPDLPRLNLVKMDIEGAEPRALQGMIHLLRRHKPILLLEFSPFLIQVTSHVSPDSFLQTVMELGYRLHILQPNQSPTSAQTIPELLRAQQLSGSTHLDLVAYPQI